MIQPSIQSSIAIIGAGLAGAALARRLVDAGRNVTVFEKDLAVGGTLRPTTRGELHVGRHLPWLWQSNRSLDKQIDRWCGEGLLTWWNPQFENGVNKRVAIEVRDPNAAGPYASRVVASLLEGVDVQRGRRIARVMRGGDAWHLMDIDHQHAGPFDGVITAIPAAQAASVMDAVPRVVAQLDRVSAHPRWTLAVAFENSLDVPYDCAHINNSPLALLVCESHKPGREQLPELWMAHATTSWSIPQQLRTEAETLPLLTEAFARALGRSSLPDLIHASTFRWDFAHTEVALGAPYLFDAEENLGCVGSWCLGNDNPPALAWDSAHALADHLISQ